MSIKNVNISTLLVKKTRVLVSRITFSHFTFLGLLIIFQQGYLVNESLASAANSSTTTLYPTDDRNTVTSGDSPVLNVNTYEHAFLRFDVSAISEINSAKLRLYANNPNDLDAAEIRI